MRSAALLLCYCGSHGQFSAAAEPQRVAYPPSPLGSVWRSLEHLLRAVARIFESDTFLRFVISAPRESFYRFHAAFGAELRTLRTRFLGAFGYCIELGYVSACLWRLYRTRLRFSVPLETV